MKSQFLMALITVPSLEVGRNIARKLLDERLAACINLIPGVNSLYVWEGKIHDDLELLMLCKTISAGFESRFTPLVLAIHPYENPEIIAFDIEAGSKKFLEWLGFSLKEDI